MFEFILIILVLLDIVEYAGIRCKVIIYLLKNICSHIFLKYSRNLIYFFQFSMLYLSF